MVDVPGVATIADVGVLAPIGVPPYKLEEVDIEYAFDGGRDV